MSVAMEPTINFTFLFVKVLQIATCILIAHLSALFLFYFL